MKSAAIVTIKFYQNFFSPLFVKLFGTGCRHYPTCSQYSIDALNKYGFIKGMQKAVYRIINCNPYSKSDYFDPA